MATEASVAEQTTDGTEEKKVVDDAKIVEEENASQHKETGESEGVGKPNVEEPASSGTIQTVSKQPTEDKKDKEPAAEAGKKEDEVEEPSVDEVKKENEEAKASSSKVVGNKEDDTSVAEVVKEEAKTGKSSNLDEPEIEASEKEPEEKPTVTAAPLSEAVQKPLVESELSLVHESDQVRQELEVAEPVTEITKTTGERLDISDSQVVPSENTTLSEEQPIALAVTESAPELEVRNEAPPEANEVVEASSVEVETGSELLKKESYVKETGSSSTFQALDAGPGNPIEVNESKAVGSRDAFPENTEKADGDVGAHGCTEETKNDESGQDASESLVKEARVDISIQASSTTIGKSEKIDPALATEAAEILVKPEVSVEEHKEEKTAVTETVEESKEVETAEKEPVDEQKEEKAVAIESTLTAMKEIVNSSGPDTEVTEDFAEKDKSSEGGDKAVEEQRDVGGSDSATEVTEVWLEKEKSSEVAEKVAEELKDDTTVVQTSKDIDLEGTNEADISIKETVGTSDVVEKTDIGSIQKDETEEKKGEGHETEKTDSQNLDESSKDGAGSKTDVEAQKSEAPAKPKTLMSKVKHSLVKVKKAIIGKSPSSRTMSAELKDESKIK